MAAKPSAPTQADILRYNQQARVACVNQGVRMVQPIFNQSFNPVDVQTLNIQPRYAGLILGFIVQISGAITNTSGNNASRTQFGGYNLLRQVVLTDLNNQQRINTAGWHLGLINSARQGFIFGGAYAPNVPENYGNNWVVQQAAATIADDGSEDFSQFFFVPCAYSMTDLRGAIYAGVVNATMQLQLTVPTNAQMGVLDAADDTLAVYTSAAPGVAYDGNVTVQVWQVYLDQLPKLQSGQPFLPVLDLNNIYELKNTSFNNPVENQDFPMAYANYRQFLSTVAVYNNGGALNVGSDIAYWKIQSANFTQIQYTSPQLQALFARQTFMADPPKGVYYFDHRSAPINTANYGNMELVLNPSDVQTNAVVLVGYEDFSQVNQLVGAASLPGG